MGNENSVEKKVPKVSAAKNNANSVQLKFFLDGTRKKVMFAEAEEDFVEILFSFLTLPLGTIARLSRKYEGKVGSLTSLHESVENLNIKHFFKKGYKDFLIYPVNSSSHVCKKLKVNLDETKPVSCDQDAMFFKKNGRFIITDDLNIIPLMMDTSIALLNSLGVESIDSLHEETIFFRLKDFSNLLKWSLLTNNPLTNLVVWGSKPCSSLFTYSRPSNSGFMSGNSSQTTVKLLVQKSKKKVLCAQVENRFVELLFSFLTIPLGAYEHLTKDIISSSPVGISNLYKSISSLGERKFLKSEYVKMMLLCPKVAANYYCVTELLPIYEVNTRPGRFLKEEATFIVSEDLKVTASQSIATFSKFNPPGVPIADMEFLDLCIGQQEALLLLKASLMSKSALTDWLRVLLYGKKPKMVEEIQKKKILLQK